MNSEVRYPASSNQQAVWLFSRMFPDSPAYNLLWQVKIRGRLDVPRLVQSLQTLLDRHESLRTCFSLENDELVQVVAPRLAVDCELDCLSGRSAEEKRSQLDALSRRLGLAPFDLEHGPLIRFRLIRVDDEDHRLLVSLHHMVTDGSSWPIFVDELAASYAAMTLPAVPMQYGKYAIWQKHMLDAGSWLPHQAYWKKILGGTLSVLDLPADHLRPQVRHLRGAVCQQMLSPELTAALKAVRKEHGSTLFKMMLAGFNVLLHKLTGETDLIVGTTLTGRVPREISDAIGFFVNTAALRAQIDGNPSFLDVLNQVQRSLDEAVLHQAYPFVEVVRCVSPVRDLSREPLSAVNFTKLPLPVERRVGPLTFKEDRVFLDTETHDLALYTQETAKGIRLTCVYNADLFESATIIRMLGHYYTLLEGIVENPDRPISRYSLLTQDERRRLSNRSNPIGPTNPFVEFKKQDIEQSISARFEHQARLFPKKLAVKTQEHQWSYTELNRQTNRIAHTLLKYCGHGGERIALLFDHGAPMIAAILGVLKSANAYVPLDPSHPQERIAYIPEDCQAAIMVTDKKNLAQALTLAKGTLEVIDVDEIDGAAPTEDPGVAVSPDALAYILYTSGSTGQPKGVMQNHRNVLHHIRCYTNNLHIAFDDKITLLSSYGFDAAVMDIFGAVLNGATLCPLDIKAGDPSALGKRIVEEAVTIYHSTPTVYRYLFAGLSCREDLSAIRLVVLGGEEAQKADVDLFKKYCSEECILVNGLGPTESTLALQCFITHGTRLAGPTVPVGYPVEDTEVVLLNETGVDAEVYGEIGIRSDHVALGYWQRPELSEAAFLPDPQGGTRRLYHTGDMGRLLPDGSIGFLGRRDFQVKIRGYRIELGEIETVLAQHPGVRETVVLAREDVPGDPSAEFTLSAAEGLGTGKQLVAYAVPNQDSSPSTSELRSFLKQKLPEYMVPAAFVFLDALPLTPSGKVDRNALPPSDQSRRDLSIAFVTPRTPVEETLARIWEEVLSLEKVGIHDNFFDLGGHSLLAMQVVARIRRSLRVEVPLRSMFEAPTIAGLAIAILKKQAEMIDEKNMSRILTDIESLSNEEIERQVMDGRK